MTTKVTRRIVSNAGSGACRAPEVNSAAISRSPSAKESIISVIERRSGRPPARRRVTSTPMPARQIALIVKSWNCMTRQATSGAAVTSSRLSGPKPPSSMPTSSPTKAITYPDPTMTRSKRLPNRPLGKARNTCRKSTAGSRSNACPIVNTSAALAKLRLVRNAPKPAAIISGPNGLAGRRVQATRPLNT